MFLFLFKKNSKPRLNERLEEEILPLVRDRCSLYVAIMLLSLVLILLIPYPGPLNVVESLFQRIGVPITSGENGMGFHFTNIFLQLILVTVFFMLNRALNWGMFEAFIFIMFLVTSTPGWITRIYQYIIAIGA